jgi:hypothetical protein
MLPPMLCYASMSADQVTSMGGMGGKLCWDRLWPRNRVRRVGARVPGIYLMRSMSLETEVSASGSCDYPPPVCDPGSGHIGPGRIV